MIYHGRIKNGVVVLDPPALLPEDTPVQVEVESAVAPVEPQDEGAARKISLAEVFKDIIGKAEGLPSDSSENHDHYLYGT